MPGIEWRRWGTIRVKGKADPQVVWEALDASQPHDYSFIALYERGRQIFENEGPAQARPHFEEANAIRPGGDPPSQFHLDWCDELQKNGNTVRDTSLSVSK